jgi:hypothetical protein
MLAGRIFELLVGKHGQRPRDAAARIARHDDIVKITAAGGDKRVREFLAIFIRLRGKLVGLL